MAEEFWININATSSGWKKAAEVWVNIDGTSTGWKTAEEVWLNIHGTSTGWRRVFVGGTCSSATCNAVTTTWGPNSTQFCNACSAGSCGYCMRLDWTDASDPCHNIDGWRSVNGGSFLLSLICVNELVANDSGCDCSAIGSYEFSCEITKTCGDQSDTHKGRLIIQLNSDSSTVCSIDGTTKTGACI